MKEDIENAVVKIDEDNRKENIKRNARPCVVCGGKDFIQLFRNVVGEVSGHMQGSFFLFGGSVSGSINGYTKTLPVLSCKGCQNEREIETWKYTPSKEWFWNQMHNFYFGVDHNQPSRFKQTQKYFLERPIETRQYMLDNKNYDHQFYNEIPTWSTEVWAKAGFNIKPVKRKFLWWTWEKYPTWEELEK